MSVILSSLNKTIGIEVSIKDRVREMKGRSASDDSFSSSASHGVFAIQ